MSMTHPFVADLSDKSIDELQTTITELNKKMLFAGRTHNQALMSQLTLVLESYNQAYSKKMSEMQEKLGASSKISITKREQ